MMKLQRLKLLCIGCAFVCFPVSLLSQTVNVTQAGDIGISCAEYLDNVTKTWDITIPGNRSLVLDYHVRVEHSYDQVLIYSIDNSGKATLQTILTGSQDGSIKSLYSNGKMRVIFTSDYSINCSTNATYTGFNISIRPVLGIQYAYDNSGNRIRRTIYLGSSGTLRSDTSDEPEEEIVFMEKLGYSTGIAKQEADVRIYPNPTAGRFAVEIGNLSEETKGEIHLMDVKGKLLEKKHLTGNCKVDFDISREVSGIYIVMIQVEDAVSTWKIIKK